MLVRHVADESERIHSPDIRFARPTFGSRWVRFGEPAPPRPAARPRLGGAARQHYTGHNRTFKQEFGRCPTTGCHGCYVLRQGGFFTAKDCTPARQTRRFATTTGSADGMQRTRLETDRSYFNQDCTR